MRKAVFDTNILIDFSHGREEAHDIIRSCHDRIISIVTWVEFLTGIPQEQEKKARDFLELTFDVYYPDEKVFEQALKNRRERKIKLPDSMIYACAQLGNAPLITRNTKDFKHDGKTVIVPYHDL